MKNEGAEKIKHLQTRSDALRLEIDQVTRSRDDINQRLDALTNQKSKIEQEIKQLSESSKEVIISEHALLRYLERVKNVDLDSIKKEILTESFVASIRTFKNGKFPIAHGVKAIVKNSVVVTIEES